MNINSPSNRMPRSFTRAGSIDAGALDRLSRAIERQNQGIFPPQQVFNNANSSSQTQTVASILVDAAADSNITLSGLQTIDGQALTAQSLVLLTAQTTAAQNGVYKPNALISGWKKYTPLQVPAVAVKNGTTYGLSWWLLQSTNNYKQIVSGAGGMTIVKAVSITNISTSGTPTVDGVPLSNGDLVLLTGQSTAAQNGIWLVGATWTKKTGTSAFIAGGTVYAYTTWANNSGTTWKAGVGVYA